MSRFHPNRTVEPLFEAAAQWRKVALESAGSIFGPGEVWSDANLASLKWHFVENPDEGEGRFLEKLKRQLLPAPKGTNQLAAEMTWFMLLCPSNIGITNKRETVETIWSWSDQPIDRDSHWLSDAVLAGAGSAGTAFNTQRWRELRFFVGFIEAFRKLESEPRVAILADGWKFATWINDVQDAGSRQLRHMMLYLMFPDDFERVFGRSDRRRIIRAFTAISDSRAASLSPLEIDRQLKTIRDAQEEKFQTKELDFYSPPLEEIWQPAEPPVEVEADVTSEFSELAKAMRHDHVLQAIREVDRDGFPHEARSTVNRRPTLTSNRRPTLTRGRRAISAS